MPEPPRTWSHGTQKWLKGRAAGPAIVYAADDRGDNLAHTCDWASPRCSPNIAICRAVYMYEGTPQIWEGPNATATNNK